MAVVIFLIDIARAALPHTVDWLKRRRWLATLLMVVSVSLAIFMILTGCATPEQIDKEAVYAHDLRVVINGQEIRGVGVVPLAQKYKIKVKPDGKIDRMIVRTCHREDVVDKPRGYVFDDAYTFEMQRDDRIESRTACALEIDVFEERKRRNGWAVIDFLDSRPEVSLPMFVRCNGVAQWWQQGVGICQAATGLIQEVSFNEPVKARSDDCPGTFPDETKTHWEFFMPKGKCTIYFAAKTKHANGLRLQSRLNTIGYTKLPPFN